MAAYLFESTGKPAALARNGYVVGKHWANVQVDEWRRGIAEGLFSPLEFKEDPELRSIRWWVEGVLGG